MKSLADYVEDVQESDSAAFTAAHPHPFLLHRPDEAPTSAGFQTDATDPTATRMELVTELTASFDLKILPVVKRPDTLFQHRICVGRTRNNDIVLPYTKISKFHAYFTWTDDGDFYLSDPGSKNGTFVNGSRLPELEPMLLEDRMVISLARHHFRYHTAEGLYRVTKELLDKKSKELS